MSDVAQSLQATLEGRYRVERELGGGGMATVYLAADLRHQRLVAIKLLDNQVASLLSVDRFLQEIRTMATLQHPHILPLFDSGEAAGTPFYVMPYVAGETLRARLIREKRLSLDDALRITREVAAALDFAHRQGVVHRDIKPENILLADGHALVADFGIARALLTDTSAVDRLTATGIALGTVGYMSPEQAAGNKHVDARTDVYALGAVTHEMLAGAPPFSGISAQVLLARILTESPPPLTQFRLGIDPRISAAVQKALAPEAIDRFPTAQAFAEALQSSSATALPIAVPMRRSTAWLVGTLAFAALAAGGWWLQQSRSTASDAAPSVRLAVIPFREVGASANASFAAGLTAALRTDLATLPNVSVIAGTSIDALGDSARTPRYVARQFGASHVIGGTVQWDSAKGEVRVRVTPELVSVVEDDERTIPGEVIEDRVDDLFQTQAHVSTQIARSLGIPLSAAAATRLASPPTRSKLAYEAYLRGQAEGSDELLKQAVALDPGFVRAWAALGSSLAINYQTSPDPAIAALAETATSRALKLDPMSAQSHVARSLYYRHIKRDFDAAVREGQESIRLAPGDAAAKHFTAASLWNSRRFDEALALARQGAALDPRRADAVARVATLLIWLRDFETASKETEKALALSHRRVSFINGNGILLPLAKGDTAGAHSFFATLPDSMAQQSLGSFLVREFHVAWALTVRQRSDVIDFLRRERARHYQLGAAEHAWLRHDAPSQAAHADSAITVLEDIVRRLPHEERLRLQLGYAYALAGRNREAKSQGDTAMATRSAWHDGFQGAANSLQYAEILALAGENDHAIALVDSLLKVPGFVTPAYLAIDPYFAPLRSNARFRQLTSQ